MRTKYVLSYELAKELNKLGVKGEALFYYLVSDDSSPKLIASYEKSEYEVNVISAFIGPELYQFLPPYIFSEPDKIPDPTHGTPPWKLMFYFDGVDWFTEYINAEGVPLLSQKGKTEAESRAKMIIYLRTNYTPREHDVQQNGSN